MTDLQTGLKNLGICTPILKAQPIETNAVTPDTVSIKRLDKEFMNIANELSGSKFVVNDANRQTIRDLYDLFTNNPNGKLDKTKGVLLIGDVGVGKTLLFKALHKLCGYCNNLEGFNSLTIKELKEKIKSTLNEDECKQYFNKFYNSYDCKDLYVDDIGRETSEMTNFGEKHLWFEEFILDRYVLFTDYGIKLHCSTNLAPAQLKEFYSRRVCDRFNEMFNFVTLKGVSFRQMWRAMVQQVKP